MSNLNSQQIEQTTLKIYTCIGNLASVSCVATNHILKLRIQSTINGNTVYLSGDEVGTGSRLKI